MDYPGENARGFLSCLGGGESRNQQPAPENRFVVHLFLEVEFIRHCHDLLGRRLRVDLETLLQRDTDRRVDRRPLLPANSVNNTLTCGICVVTQPRECVIRERV